MEIGEIDLADTQLPGIAERLVARQADALVVGGLGRSLQLKRDLSAVQ